MSLQPTTQYRKIAAVRSGRAVFLASAESDGITGRLFSALWDDWPRLAQKRDVLARSDIYTLRRITPEDRGHQWQCA